MRSRPTRRYLRLALLAALALLSSLLVGVPAVDAAAPAWHLGTPPLTTPWTHLVGPHNALPEYPRPQLTRPRWQNLNGVWQFSSAVAGEKPPVGRDLNERILVPYPVESALSGIQRHEERMWYRRTVTVPKDWRIGQRDRLLLHFGAVDWDTTVWVNGHKVAHHTGGYDSWTADITGAVFGSGPQEVVVGVYDPTDAGGQPVGKQRNSPSHIFYTPSSGIWQTVWMEPVAPTYVDSLVQTPRLGSSTLALNVRTQGATSATTVQATAYAGTKKVGTVSGAPNSGLSLPVPSPHLWSPSDPYLYNLTVTVRQDGKVVDTAKSYFGMRSVSTKKGKDGKLRMVLNGKFVFGMGTLDQGFWPDGIYTAPTDTALKYDLVQQKQLGYNTVRKHIKVEPARWYYDADKLGLMVWQDMPAMTTDRAPDAAAQANFESELHRMVNQLRSTTSIVMWEPFNEGWGEYDPARIADEVKTWDPTRLVNNNSGSNCCGYDGGNGDVIDNHTYVGPGVPSPSDTRVAVDGEYGGLGLQVPGHEYQPGQGSAYENEPDAATLTTRYVELAQKVQQAEMVCGLSAAIYTQPTDVENEDNGLFTYDRDVLKVDRARVTNANQAIVAAAAHVGGGGQSVPPGTPGLAGVDAYAFDEGTGQVAHDSVGAHDGTLTDGPVWTAGHSGSALQFNGTSSYVDTGAQELDTTGSYSVSAWVKVDNPGDSFQTAVSQDGDSNSAFFLQYSGADHRFAFSFAGVRALAQTAPTANTWYHLVGVRDAVGQALHLYVDGSLAGSADACLGDASSGHTVIGRGQYGGKAVDYWQGAIDQVHVFDRALSADEVQQLYTSGT